MHTASYIDTGSAVWKDPDDMPHNPATILDLMSVEVANILALERSMTMEEYLGSSAEGFSSLVEMAKAADRRLATWPDLIPAEWFPKRVRREAVPESVARAGIYGDGYDIYSDVLVCCTWNSWRSARLRLLALITKYEPDEEALESIQVLADEVCGTFPFILGDRMEPTTMFSADIAYPSLEGQPVPLGHHQTAAGFGGWNLHTPFNKVLRLGMYLRQGQLAWLRNQGERLARVYHVTPTPIITDSP